MEQRTHTLSGHSVGAAFELISLHYGSARPGGSIGKAYLQASLHADETPGMLVMHHLRQMLASAEARGDITGEIVLVPFANPIGLAQGFLYSAFGRFEMSSGENFNRRYPDLFALLPTDIHTRLGRDARENTHIVRAILSERLRATPVETHLEALRQVLFLLAFDADIVLDLHCDQESVMHLYTEEPYWDRAEALARYLGAETVLLARGSGAFSFDEACSGVWWQLADRLRAEGHGKLPIELACCSATVELRGQADVEHDLSRADARALINFLCLRGFIRGVPDELPPLLHPATPLAGLESVKAPHAGVVVFRKSPGQWVEAGEIVAEVIDPITNVTSEVAANCAGVLFARTRRRYAMRGASLCKIAGAKATRTGNLLSP